MLKALANCFGVSGMEDSVRRCIEEQLRGYDIKLRTDAMGNLHAMVDGDGPPILVTTYMDEPGIIVTKITEDGYLQFETIGPVAPSCLVSKRVWIGTCPGIISLKAIHLTKKKERETPVKASQLFVDIGANTREEAAKIAEIGDYGTFDIPYRELENHFVKGRAIAGRMGCVAAIELLKKSPDCNLHVIFATQRQIGCRGMIAASWNLEADFTVVLDGIAAQDYTTAPKEGRPQAGEGVALLHHSGSGKMDATFYSMAKKVAEEEEIPIQNCSVDEKGQEQILQQTGKKQRCLCLGIPVRYPESLGQVANIKDLQAMIRLSHTMIHRVSKGGGEIL